MAKCSQTNCRQPFSIDPETEDEVDIYNKKLHDGYEVTIKSDETFVNNFSNLLAVFDPKIRDNSEA